MDHFVSGSLLEPEIAKRVRARAERITAEVYRKLGAVNVALGLVRDMDDEQGDGNFTCAASVATMAAMQWEIEKLREERALYLDAFYAAKHAGQPAEPLPSFEELSRTTSTKINLIYRHPHNHSLQKPPGKTVWPSGCPT